MPPTEHDVTVAGALGSLKATAETTLRMVEELKAQFAKTSSNLDERVKKLERWQAYVLGAAAVIGFVASQIGEVFHLSLK